MAIIEIKKDNYTETMLPKNDLLLDLINDETLRNTYFEKLNIEQYTFNYYKNLTNELTKCLNKKRRKEESFINHIFEKTFINDILDNNEMRILILKSNIAEFEKNLSYLLFFEKITIDEAKIRGFNNTFLEKLLEECKNIVNNPYNHYFTYESDSKDDIKIYKK